MLINKGGIYINRELKITIDYNINPNPQDISKLIEIQHRFLNSDYITLTLVFDKCNFINSAVAVIIGTLSEYSRLNNKEVKLYFKKGNPVFDFMKQVGIYEYYKKDHKHLPNKSAIPFNKISNEDTMETYTNKIMELAPIKMIDEAKDILSSYFCEIYQNALFHANSKIDIFSCGYWMAEKKQLIFSIYDMGIGIPHNIRHYLKRNITSKECIEWAFTEGKSTIEDKYVKRGLGLSRLEQFINLNKGTMSIYSDDICCIITNNSREFISLDIPIKGTLIIIQIVADTEHIYFVE